MGKIIVIEGTDSSGKETQTKLLYERKIYDKTIRISFPNYDSPACEPVKMYLAGRFGTDATKVNPYPISTMYAIDRYASFKQDWEKKYIDDYVIITDRYVTSNMIHQASKIKDNEEKDEYLNYFVTRHIIWYLLFSGVDATPQRFMEEYKRLFEWLKNQGYKLSIPFYSKKIKSEPFKNRLIISIFNFLSKIGLVSIFTKIYCKGK